MITPPYDRAGITSPHFETSIASRLPSRVPVKHAAYHFPSDIIVHSADSSAPERDLIP